ncbi:MAG: S-layer homology domain-containing protein, partial [Okeania sp. SIO3B3]|nr:S-layer homology domain-containing protein [Okeania sp. SIO3B3]
DPAALRAVLADAENNFSNIRRVFGYTRLFRPDKTVSRAEAAAVLWYFGDQKEGISAQMALRQSDNLQ